jgi:heat-inducible transcriptional repressor
MVMSARAQDALKIVVERFIATGEPVGARTLADMPTFHLSTATLRNTLALLTDEGFLSKPHSSSGRAPTDKGYRAYVDSLMTPASLSEAEVAHMRSAADPESLREIADTLTAMSRALSHLSERVAVIGLASWLAAPIKSIHFVRLTDRMAMAVTVTRGGQVRSQVIRLADDFSQDLLDRLSNYFNHRFGGRTLTQIRVKLTEETLRLQERADLLLRWSLAVAQAVDDAAGADGPVVVNGTSNLLTGGSVVDAERLHEAMATLGEQGRMAGLLAELLKAEGIRYFIGVETNIDSFADLSVVGRAIGLKGAPIGAVGIIGPKSMNYGRAAALVAAAADEIHRRLAGADADRA